MADTTRVLEELVAKPECEDYTEANQGDKIVGGVEHQNTCWLHLQWAMGQGLTEHSDWYPTGTTRTPADAQCALYLKAIGANDGNAHACMLPPCASISDSMKEGGVDANVTKCMTTRVETVVTTTEAPGPSIEWWGWCLIAVAILGVIGAIVGVLLGTKKPKKKRALKVVDPQVEEPPNQVQVAATVTYDPIYQPTVYEPMQEETSVLLPAQQSVVLTAAPQVVTAQPVTTSAGSFVMPMSAAPAYAAPTLSLVQAAPSFVQVGAPAPAYQPVPMQLVSAVPPVL